LADDDTLFAVFAFSTFGVDEKQKKEKNLKTIKNSRKYFVIFLQTCTNEDKKSLNFLVMPQIVFVSSKFRFLFIVLV
jgi:hypothetical protein